MKEIREVATEVYWIYWETGVKKLPKFQEIVCKILNVRQINLYVWYLTQSSYKTKLITRANASGDTRSNWSF